MMVSTRQSFLAAVAATIGVLGSAVAFAASPDDQPTLFVNQWVQQSESQTLTGKIVVPQANGVSVQVKLAHVALVGENGVIRQSKTSPSGSFTFDDVTPGIYSLTARGKDSFSVVALHVVEKNREGADQLPKSVVMPAAIIDFATVNSAVVRYLPPSGSAAPKFSMNTANVQDLASKIVGTDLFRIAQVDGGMSGQIFTAGASGSTLPAAGQSNVFVIRDGEEVARTVTNDDGTFTIANIPLGRYSILAVGPAGLGLIGAELVSPASLSDLASKKANSKTLVAQLQNSMGETFAMQMAPVPGVGGSIVSDTLIAESVIGESYTEDDDDGAGAFFDGAGNPVGGGGGGGPGAFGGGGGGGGGGLLGGRGGLGLLMAGGVAAAIAVSSDDDNDSLPPVPATPSDL